MLYQIPYTIYDFTGKIIDYESYISFKTAFLKNPNLQFPEPKTYYSEHKGEAQVTIGSLIICIILAPFGDDIEGTFLMLILAMSFIAFGFSLFFQFSQYFSFQKSRNRKILFFNNLKKDIIETESYPEFAKRQENYIRSNGRK